MGAFLSLETGRPENPGTYLQTIQNMKRNLNPNDGDGFFWPYTALALGIVIWCACKACGAFNVILHH
jgi:hypothetical protein